MLFSRLPRLPWQLTCLLFAAVATATITPSNSSTTSPRWQGTIQLKHAASDSNQIAGLVPLNNYAAQRTFEGYLHNTNFSTTASISNGEVAYISCNPNDYPGNVDAQRVFDDAHQTANLTAIILYSTQSDYCDYNVASGQASLANVAILSMTKKQDSATVLASIINLPSGSRYFVITQYNGSSGNNQSNPLGPTPSTAVAMIILYAITGCITGLFLIIIITGAVRAHRHPERYGPRNVIGRPRQSRARGLGRAILETIPIVKFGEKEPVKPTDVELGSATETREVDATTNVPPAQDVAETKSVKETPAVVAATTTTTTADTPSATAATVEHSGIAPAETLAPGVGVAALADGTTNNDSSLGCSICTEDFEKGQDLRVLPCDHKFHPECIDPWLLNVSGTCPLCRVDLRPVATHETTASASATTPSDPDTLAPPLNPEAELSSSRRRTAFRDILSLRHRPNASTEERISALRRLREQGVAEGADAGADEAARNGRSRRVSTMLGDVFSGRTRRVSPNQETQRQQQQSRDGASTEAERRV